MPVRTPTVSPTAREGSALSSIRALVAALTRSARAVERRSGMTNAQLFVLLQIAGEGGLTINELAERAMTTQSTASILVSRLSSGGYVRRARSDTDARRVIVTLTPKGRRLAARAPEPPTARLVSALRDMSTAELRSLERGLAPLLRRMHVDPVRGPMLFETPAGGRQVRG